MHGKHRRYTTGSMEVRQAEGDTPPVIAGYAAVFNQETVIADSFREVFRPGAFKRMVEQPPSGIKALFNHNADAVLGAISSGTLRLSEDSHGLRYEVDINTEDAAAMSVLAKIRRGDVDKSSFAFSVPEGGQKITRDSGSRMHLREVLDADLYDVSVVAFPAYEGSSVSARAESPGDADVIAELMDPVAPDESWRVSVNLSRERCRLVDVASR